MDDLFFPLPTSNHLEAWTDSNALTVYEADTPVLAQRNALADPYLAPVARLESSTEERNFLLDIGWNVMPEKDMDGYVAAILELYPKQVASLQTFSMAILGQIGEPQELAYWTLKLLDAHTLDVGQVLSGTLDKSEDYIAQLKTILGNRADLANLMTGQAIEAQIKTLDTAVQHDLYGKVTDCLYQNLFGRAADEDGKNYWISTLESGAVNILQLTTALINGAGPADAYLLDAKEDIAYDALQHLVNNNIITNQDIAKLGEPKVEAALQWLQDSLAEYDASELGALLNNKPNLINDMLQKAGVVV